MTVLRRLRIGSSEALFASGIICTWTTHDDMHVLLATDRNNYVENIR